MSLYEVTILVRQDVSNQDVDKITASFVDVVKNNGGEVLLKEYWGLRSLAYEINKNRKAHYVFLGINASNKALEALEFKVRYHEDVVRSMTIKVEALPEGGSAVMNQNKRGDRDDRRDDRFDAA